VTSIMRSRSRGCRCSRRLGRSKRLGEQAADIVEGEKSFAMKVAYNVATDVLVLPTKTSRHFYREAFRSKKGTRGEGKLFFTGFRFRSEPLQSEQYALGLARLGGRVHRLYTGVESAKRTRIRAAEDRPKGHRIDLPLPLRGFWILLRRQRGNRHRRVEGGEKRKEGPRQEGGADGQASPDRNNLQDDAKNLSPLSQTSMPGLREGRVE